MTEFDDVIRLLRDERPRATELELDEIKQRVRRRAAEPSRKGKQSMKSRIAILGLLVSGLLFSTAGAGLALQGTSSGDNASIAQYATPTPTPEGTVTPQSTPEGGILPAEANAPTATPTPTPTTDGGVLPAENEETPTPTPEPETQVVRQQAVAAGETSQLPFTGFAAVPVLVGGLALLTAGLVLRRRTRSA